MKVIENTRQIRPKILAALDKIADPVVQTLSPKGRNALFEDSSGNIFVTNDGVTIARQIESDDPIEDSIIRTVKYAALSTNREAGDGTTTTTLFARYLIKNGYKLIDDGINEMDLRSMYNDFAKRIISKLDPIKVDNDEQIKNIAKISANNDDEIADNVLKVVKTAGLTGLVFINPSKTGKTEVVEDTGYVLNHGFFAPELINDGINRAAYENVHVLITDKRIYYEEECQHILSVALENGIQNLVIVAKDFIGKAPNFLLANHVNKFINLLLVKYPDDSGYGMSDLATYLGGKVVTEKSGKLINNLSVEDFIVAAKVYSTHDRSVFQTINPFHPGLDKLVSFVKDELAKDKENKDVERRLSSLTNGVVTVNVGGATPIEVQENIYRYEDSINAARAAMRDGYLVGGGLAIFNATRDEKESVFKRFGEESVRQIARNCGRYEDYIISNIGGNIGYNAKSDTFEDLLKAGVIDPYKVTENAIKNAVSVAIAILTSGFIIVNKKEDNDSDK